jgi:carbonic anhydrase
MDISPNNVAGECELKCNYYFNYSNSNCLVGNTGTSLNFTYDKSVQPPVVYNENKYNVSIVSLVTPSVHLFNSNQTNAELIIIHQPVSTGNMLVVCIPVKVFASFKNSGSLLDTMIGRAAAGAPKQGTTVNLPITNYNLNSLVPKDAFYSYSDKNVDFIIFGSTSAIPITQDSINKLSQILKPSTPIPAGHKLFYNKKGPALTGGGGISNSDIYIDCQPTDSSKEEVMVSADPGVPQTQYDLGNATGFTSFLQIFLLALVIFAMLFGCYYFISKINTKYTGQTITPGKTTLTKKTFTFTNKEGASTAIYLIAYIMWAALLAGFYFYNLK